jgi:AraC family transcriptional regulator of adaptative response/methylated-DNA-[protein]-cysteine methyltransferase
MSAMTDIVQDPRWQALVARDSAADGRFVYGVRSTGVCCRPSCSSRPARSENVTLHANGAAAERAGFRACKRCKPDGNNKQSAPDWDAMGHTLGLVFRDVA